MLNFNIGLNELKPRKQFWSRLGPSVHRPSVVCRNLFLSYCPEDTSGSNSSFSFPFISPTRPCGSDQNVKTVAFSSALVPGALWCWCLPWPGLESSHFHRHNEVPVQEAGEQGPPGWAPVHTHTLQLYLGSMFQEKALSRTRPVWWTLLVLHLGKMPEVWKGISSRCDSRAGDALLQGLHLICKAASQGSVSAPPGG